MTRAMVVLMVVGLRLPTAVAQASPQTPVTASLHQSASTAAPADAVESDVMYDRPVVVATKYASIGGYLEAHAGYAGEDGIDQGPSFEFRRFNLFVYSPIRPWIRLLAELEFEHGTEEIKLETAQVDFDIVPELSIRAGIILPPIGSFNQDHDAPKWDFVDRPLVSTEIFGATLSEVGAGVVGFVNPRPGWELGYQIYASQGLAGGVVDQGETYIPRGRDPGLFEVDNNRSPAVSARSSLGNGRFEVGISNYSAVYNEHVIDGERIDKPRWLTMTALDMGLELWRLALRAEAGVATIDVPDSLEGPFAQTQYGFHVDSILTVWAFRSIDTDFRLNCGLRTEFVDMHAGKLRSTNSAAGNGTWRLTPSLALRAGESTVLRLNYHYQWQSDLLGNPPARSAALRVGLATYF